MNKELKSAVILNYVFIVLMNVFSIVLAPVLIKGMGMTVYGLYVLAVSTTGYFLITDFSIGNYIIRNLTRLRITGSKEDRENFLFSAFWVYILFTFAVAGICFAISYFAGTIFKHSMDLTYIAQFRSMFGILILSMSFSILQNFFFSILAGYEKFVFTRTCYIVKYILRFAMLCAFMALGMDAIFVCIAEMLLNLLHFAVYAFYTLYILKQKIKFHRRDSKMSSEMLRQMSSIYIMAIADSIFWNAGNFIIGMFYGPDEIGLYSIAITFYIIILQLTTAVSGYLLPQLTKHVVEGDSMDTINAISINISRMINVLAALIVVGFFAVGMDFIRLWVGNAFEISFYLAVIFMASIYIPQVQNINDTVIQAKNKFGFRALLTICCTLMCIVVNLVAIQNFGVQYAWVGLTGSVLVFRVIVYNIYLHRIGLNMFTYWKKVFPRMAVVLVLSVGAGLVLWLVPVPNILIFFLKALFILVFYFVCIWMIYLTREEKETAAQIIKPYLSKLKIKKGQ